MGSALVGLQPADQIRLQTKDLDQEISTLTSMDAAPIHLYHYLYQCSRNLNLLPFRSSSAIGTLASSLHRFDRSLARGRASCSSSSTVQPAQYLSQVVCFNRQQQQQCQRRRQRHTRSLSTSHIVRPVPATSISNAPCRPSIFLQCSTWSANTRHISTMASMSAENARPHDIPTLSPVEASKRLAAYKAVEDHFDPSYKYIGIGSGSTVVYVVEAIAAKGRNVTNNMIFVPTGDQSKQLIIEAGLPLGSIDSLPPVQEGAHKILSGEAAFSLSTGLQDLGLKGKRQSLDVAFDGADEIDEDLNCIKGGGACLFQEKLVATSAKKFICVAGNLNRDFMPGIFLTYRRLPQASNAPFVLMESHSD